MKKKSDPRHLKRLELVKALFESSFRDNSQDQSDLLKETVRYLTEIDEQIRINAPAWPVDQIPPMDLAILRVAIWELLYKEDKEPYKALIDEAVEIAKEYGTESSAGFINGVLGTVVKNNKKIVK